MEFRTHFTIEPATHKFIRTSNVMTIGSCFSEVIGNRLKEQKIPVCVNPFGTLFNPMSIFKLLNPNCHQPDERLFVEHQGTWLHYDFHSQFFGETQHQLKIQLVATMEEVKRQIATLDTLIITLGTSFVYQLKGTPSYLANCHKMPSNLFERDLLSVKDICKGFSTAYKALKEQNPRLRIVLTVSPVRHTKDGIPENQVSKAILRAACHYLISDYQDVEYFPAYELMMDDLRDYRFYKTDMIHPNEVAEQYIYEHFAATYFDKSLLEWIIEWQKIQRALTHRPIQEKSIANQHFLANLLTDLQRLHEGGISVEKEIEEVSLRVLKIKNLE